MQLVFPDQASFAGGVPEAPISGEFGHRLNVTLDCVSAGGAVMDAEALGMRQWKVFIIADPDGHAVLGEWPLANPVGGTFSVSIGLYQPQLYEYIAGRIDKAALMQLRGYAVDGSEDSLAVTIEFPMLLTYNGNTMCPQDLHRVLLLELSNAVDLATAAAVQAETAAASVPDVQDQVEHAVSQAVSAVSAYAVAMTSDALAAVSQATVQAEAAGAAVASVATLLDSAVAVTRDARIVAEGTDSQASAIGLEKSARGWYQATVSQADIAGQARQSAQAAASQAQSAASTIPNFDSTFMSMKSMDDFTSALGSSMNKTISRAWNEGQRKWDFSIV